MMRKRFTEASENDIILDAIYELTHYKVDGVTKPTFFDIKELRDNYGLTIKEIVDIANRNDYNVYKFKEDENSKPIIIISAKELSYEDVEKSFKEYVDMSKIDSDTHSSFNESKSKSKLRWHYYGPVYHFKDIITRDFEDWTEAVDKYHAFLNFNSKAKKKYGFIQGAKIEVDKKLIEHVSFEDEEQEEKSKRCEKCDTLLLDDGTCPKCDRHYEGESLDESLNEEEILYYPSLEITVTRQTSPASYNSRIGGMGGWSPAESEDIDMTVEYDYTLDKDEVVEALYDLVIDNKEVKDSDTEEEILKYVSDNYDSLFEKYNKELLHRFEDYARERAEEEYSRDDLDEDVNEEVVEETSEYKIVKTIQHNFKTVKGVAKKGKDKVIYQVYFKTQDFNPATNRWMNKGWSISTSDFDTLEDAREYVKKYGKELKEDITKEIKIKDNENIEKDSEKCPLPVEVIPNNIGINLSNVDKVKWEEQDDGQLKKVEIDFIPADDLEEDIEKQYFLCAVYGGYNCQELLADNIEVYAKDEETAKRQAIKIYKQEYNYSKEDNPYGLEAKIVSDNEEDSLEEDIEKHDTLNQKLFDGEELRPEVKETIEKIADTFVKELGDDGIKFTLKDIILLGSNVSYNYTKDSDLDIHLIADSSDLHCPDELYSLLYSAYRSMFNKNYDIKIKGIPAEIYVEMDEPQAKSNGIYSLNKGWLKKPVQKNIPELDKEAFDKLFIEWEDKYFDLIERVNEELSDDIYSFIEDLYDLRKESIAKEGEYGLGNLVFKEFRNLGYLDNLKELRKQEKGKELSLENLDNSTKEEIVEKLSESLEDDFWNLRELEDSKYGEGNLILDGDSIRPITKDELKNKFAVSLEHADKQDFKSKEELEKFAKDTGAERIMFYFQPGDNYSGEYSLLYSGENLDETEDKVLNIAKEYTQQAYALYDENGNYHEILLTESLKEAIIKEDSEDNTMGDDIVYGYKVPSDMVGYYKVEFFDDDGRCKNHWLSGNQVQYFKNREDAVKYIDEVRSWNAISFTQTLIRKIR